MGGRNDAPNSYPPLDRRYYNNVIMLLTFAGAIPREEVDNDGGGGDGLAT